MRATTATRPPPTTGGEARREGRGVPVPLEEQLRQEVFSQRDELVRVHGLYSGGKIGYEQFVALVQRLEIDLPPSFFNLIRNRRPDFTLTQLVNSLVRPGGQFEPEYSSLLERPSQEWRPSKMRPQTADLQQNRVEHHSRKRTYGLKFHRAHDRLILGQPAADPDGSKTEVLGAEERPEVRAATLRALITDLVAGRLGADDFLEAVELLHGDDCVVDQFTASRIRRSVDEGSATFHEVHHLVSLWAAGPKRDVAADARLRESDSLSDIDAREHKTKTLGHLETNRNVSNIPVLSPRYRDEEELASPTPSHLLPPEMRHESRRKYDRKTTEQVSTGVAAVIKELDDERAVAAAAEIPLTANPLKRRTQPPSKIFWEEEEAAKGDEVDIFGRTGPRATERTAQLQRTQSSHGLKSPYGYESETARAQAPAAGGKAFIPGPPRGGVRTGYAMGQATRAAHFALAPEAALPADRFQSERQQLAAAAAGAGFFVPRPSDAQRALLAAVQADPERAGTLRRVYGRALPFAEVNEAQLALFGVRPASSQHTVAVVTPAAMRVLQRRLQRGRGAYVATDRHTSDYEVFPLASCDFSNLFVVGPAGSILPIVPASSN